MHLQIRTKKPKNEKHTNMKDLLLMLLVNIPLIFIIGRWVLKRSKNGDFNIIDYLLSIILILAVIATITATWNVLNYKAYRLLYSGETVYVTKSGGPKLYHDDEYCDEIELQSWEDRIVEIPIEIAEELGYTRCDICP